MTMFLSPRSTGAIFFRIFDTDFQTKTLKVEVLEKW